MESSTFLVFGYTSHTQFDDQPTATIVSLLSWISPLAMLLNISYFKSQDNIINYQATIVIFTLCMYTLVTSTMYLQLFLAFEVLSMSSILMVLQIIKSTHYCISGTIVIILAKVADLYFYKVTAKLFKCNQQYGVLTQYIGDEVYSLPSTCLQLTLALVSKSGFIVLISFLNKAMSAPATTSLLLHSSTLVIASVYMAHRLQIGQFIGFFYFSLVSSLLSFIVGYYSRDIKHSLAYSTAGNITLSFSIISISTSSLSVGHAVYKASLFASLVILLVFMSNRHHRSNHKINYLE